MPVRLLLSMLALLAACTPTVNVNFGGPERGLREETVLEPHASGAKVALIDVTGLIADASRPSLLGRGENPVDEAAKRLERARTDPAVRAVVLRINSPGGTVTGSATLYDEVRRFRADSGKPVVASMGEVAASGGYYLALAADAIVAQPTTLTGSIGVIIPTINLSEGLGMIGVRSRALTSGPNKDLANPLEPPRERHYAVLQAIVDDFYASFRSRVVERRPAIDAARLDELTDGRVVTGAAAHAAGLVDHLGGVREAFALAKDLAGVSSARLVKYPGASDKGPRSPYALADASGAQVNLVQLNLAGADALPHSGVYYLWTPAWESLGAHSPR
ncbi:MAG: signal peptide peptidase SppA [Phycisphaerae bacterium]|nr:signal peptide peptidase SppA [Phycisphaerae bacterium]